MILKLINSIIILIILNSVYCNEYFKKSIFQLLIEKNGQFKSDLELLYVQSIDSNNITLGKINLAEEKHDFKRGLGEFVEELQINEDNKTTKFLYINHNNSKEIYSIDDVDDVVNCVSTDTIKILNNYAPLIVYNSDLNYLNLGLSVLWFVLLENQKDAKCENIIDENKNKPMQCTLIFRDLIKLEYYFESKSNYEMHPNLISLQIKDKNSNTWNVKREYDYIDFKPKFNNLESIIDTDLPIGFTCKRLQEFEKYYPKLPKTNYGNLFKLELDVNFTYLDIPNDYKNKSKYYYYYYEDNYNFFEDAFLSKIYTTKLNVNLNKFTSVEETIDETNLPIKSIYNREKNILYRINLNDNKCTTYKMTSQINPNYYYIQQLFANEPEFFYADSNYTYLGEGKVGDVDCLIFERTFISETLKEESLIKNLNSIKPSTKIVTHWYPKKSNYFLKSELSIPLKIQIGLYNFFRINEMGTITIILKSYTTKIDNNFDISNCNKN